MPGLPLPGNNLYANGSDSKIRVEFAVNISKHDELETIREALANKGINLVSADLANKSIQLELGQTDGKDSEIGNVQSLQRFLEKKTGFTTVVKGLGELSSAVAELRPSTSAINDGQQVMGVVRISQLSGENCFVDCALDGLEKGDATRKGLIDYLLAIHEYGDLGGDTFSSIGDPMIQVHKQTASDSGRSMSIRTTIPSCSVASLIGRAVALTEKQQPTGTARVLSAGVIARASTIEANTKQICSCSGKSLWQERLERQPKEDD